MFREIHRDGGRFNGQAEVKHPKCGKMNVIGGKIEMKNLGFISKKRVAREIAKIYNEHNNTPCDKAQFMRDCEAQSSLNLLCSELGIAPMHLSKLGGGTGEMIKRDGGTTWND